MFLTLVTRGSSIEVGGMGTVWAGKPAQAMQIIAVVLTLMPKQILKIV